MTTRPDTRQQIIEAADGLFYRQGFEHTSFAHIAAAVGISRGNFYHHFKSKDEILAAVIALRVERTRAMLEEWERGGATPRQRIGRFVRMLLDNREPIMQYGCPVGTLCAELEKLKHASRAEAAGLFRLFNDWLAQQFRALGCGRASRKLALHLLGRSQGVATLASALGDEDYIRAEVREMEGWLDAVAAGRV